MIRAGNEGKITVSHILISNLISWGFLSKSFNHPNNVKMFDAFYRIKKTINEKKALKLKKLQIGLSWLISCMGIIRGIRVIGLSFSRDLRGVSRLG